MRLAALDPDAGAALRVIAYFDQLVDTRACITIPWPREDQQRLIPLASRMPSAP